MPPTVRHRRGDHVRPHRQVRARNARPRPQRTVPVRHPAEMAQIEPLVLEDQAVKWLIEHGVAKTRKVGFKEYMNN